MNSAGPPPEDRPRSFSQRAVARAVHTLPTPLLRLLRRTARGPQALLQQHIIPRLFGLRVRHVSGPRRVEYGPDEVLLISVVRDGELHMQSFLDHHFALGVRHMVILDNGSADRTVEIASACSNVTVLSTRARYHVYENVMKRYLARRFSRNRWNLMVDVDERFDYPFSGSVPLRHLIGYLNTHGYTAVVGHMLDRFPDVTLAELDRAPQRSIVDEHPYIDTSNITSRPYRWGRPGHPAIREYKGGIRHTLFDVDGGLTKTPLVFVDGRIHLFVAWHHTLHSSIADFDTVLLHFPFVGFRHKVDAALAGNRYGQFSWFYEHYSAALRNAPERRTVRAMARRYESAEALLEDGFLVATERFRQWLCADAALRRSDA